MYEELTHIRIIIDDLEANIISVFERIINICEEDPKRDDHSGERYFDFDDFNKAVTEHPEILTWIENPQNFFK